MKGGQQEQCLAEASSILHQHARLRELHDKYGTDVEARWTSMKEGVRRKCLKSAIPGIPDSPVYQRALENTDDKGTERLASQVNCE